MNILLGVTGSIAAYKSYDIARQLVKEGHQVKVVLSQGALEFITPNTFRYLGVQSVYLPLDDFNIKLLSPEQNVLHIELVKWADKFVIAPLSANTLARLNLGITNDLLSSIFTARGSLPTLLFPAMNTEMWSNERNQKHIHEVINKTTILINPDSGLLACGDIGEGKLPTIEVITSLINTLTPGIQREEIALITAGATVSPLDPVRYLTNPSTGKMGFEIAKTFLSKGYKVILLVGHSYTSEINTLLSHPNFKLISSPTTRTMKDNALKYFPTSKVYISTAAIADIEFSAAPQKIKKEAMKNSLSFNQAPDVLKEVLKIKKSFQKVVSFAAETETTNEIFLEKMQRKPVDLMIGNKVSNGLISGDKMEGFQTESGTYFFITSEVIGPPLNLSKKEVAQKILHWFEGGQ